MDLTQLTDEELAAHHTDVLAEQERRQRLIDIPQQIDELRGQYEAAGGNPDNL